MEHQYSSVQKDILDMFNRTGGDIGKTYDEMERRFENYNKQEIISILSWFRYSGYTKGLGNGNSNNEKEIILGSLFMSLFRMLTIAPLVNMIRS